MPTTTLMATKRPPTAMWASSTAIDYPCPAERQGHERAGPPARATTVSVPRRSDAAGRRRGTRLLARERRGRDRHAVRAARTPGRLLLLSRRTTRRAVRRRPAPCATATATSSRAARPSTASRPTTPSRTARSAPSSPCRSRCSSTPTTRSPSATAPGASARTAKMGILRSAFVVDADGRLAARVLRREARGHDPGGPGGALGMSGRRAARRRARARPLARARGPLLLHGPGRPRRGRRQGRAARRGRPDARLGPALPRRRVRLLPVRQPRQALDHGRPRRPRGRRGRRAPRARAPTSSSRASCRAAPTASASATRRSRPRGRSSSTPRSRATRPRASTRTGRASTSRSRPRPAACRSRASRTARRSRSASRSRTSRRGCSRPSARSPRCATPSATGRGHHVQVSLFDSQLAWLANRGSDWLVGGEEPQRLGNAHPAIVPYEAFPTSDGHVIVAIGTDEQFARFCPAAGLADLAADERYATNARASSTGSSSWRAWPDAIRRRPTADWLAMLEAANVPGGPVRTIPEAFAHAPYAVVEHAHPRLGPRPHGALADRPRRRLPHGGRRAAAARPAHRRGAGRARLRRRRARRARCAAPAGWPERRALSARAVPAASRGPRVGRWGVRGWLAPYLPLR